MQKSEFLSILEDPKIQTIRSSRYFGRFTDCRDDVAWLGLLLQVRVWIQGG